MFCYRNRKLAFSPWGTYWAFDMIWSLEWFYCKAFLKKETKDLIRQEVIDPFFNFGFTLVYNRRFKSLSIRQRRVKCNAAPDKFFTMSLAQHYFENRSQIGGYILYFRVWNSCWVQNLVGKNRPVYHHDKVNFTGTFFIVQYDPLLLLKILITPNPCFFFSHCAFLNWQKFL